MEHIIYFLEGNRYLPNCQCAIRAAGIGTGSILHEQGELFLFIPLAEDGIFHLITHVSYIREYDSNGLVLEAFFLCSHQQGPMLPCVEEGRL
jgi:hypothetical protein